MGYTTTMQTITQYPRWVRVVAPLTIVALLGAFIHYSNADTEEAVPKRITTPYELLNPVDAQSFGFAVAGVVESAHSVTVRALTGGVVRERFVREGASVREGEPLLRQEIPLLSERMALQDAQNGLGTLMQDASVIGRTAEKESARIQRDAATTSAFLVRESSAIGVESATSLLTTQVYGSVTALVSALDFIDANESRFPGEDLREFRKTVNDLYGSNRTYLNGPVQYGFDEAKDILNFLDTVTENNTYPDNATLVEIGTLVDRELDAIVRVLVSGEKDFLDQKIVPQYGELYTQYLTYRGSVIEAQANLRMVLGSARGASAQGKLSVLSSDTEHTLRTIGYTTASGIAANALKMAEQTSVISGAAMNLLSGEELLGMPKAPFDGVVDQVFVKVGDSVSPGTPLLTLVGSGAKELTVSVPFTMLPYLMENAPFTVDGSVVGHVAHFGRTGVNGNVTVVIQLDDDEYTPGMTLRGEIQCALESDGAFAIPRAYVAFDNQGAYVRTESWKLVRVIILHDTGKTFIVRPVEELREKITKAIGVSMW